MAERVIYKVVDNTPNVGATEAELNELAQKGWRVVGFSQYQILLERTKDEKQEVEQING